MTGRIEELVCPLCSTEVSDPVAVRTYLAPFNRQDYSLHGCAGCRLQFWTPLKIVPEFYEEEGFAAYADYHMATRPFPPWARPFFERMPRSAGRLLDVGCGDGSFLSRAHAQGFESYGIDLDEKSVRTATSVFGLANVVRSTLDAYVKDCVSTEISFDVISFFEVLEHQDQPSAFLEQVLSILRPGGYVSGSVPNARRFLANVDRRVAAGDLPPHHFLWFSQETLESFFRRHRLSAIVVVPSGNITFTELRGKFAALVLNKLGIGMGRRKIIGLLVAPLAIVAASLLWLGYRARPAHLYFQARKLQEQP